MSQQPRRSVGLRASSQRDETFLIGSPEPMRSRSAERSTTLASGSGSWDIKDGTAPTISNRSRIESVDSIGHSRIQRSNSDPFDDGGEELEQVPDRKGGIDSIDNNNIDQKNKVKSLPTLYRFPCTQTRNQNCWSETPAEMFMVRGPNYMDGDKTKIRCNHYLFQARGCDLFLTDGEKKGTDDIILQSGLGGNIRKKPTFMFRFLFPWGQMIQYYEVPTKLVPFMEMGLENEEINKLNIEGFSNAEKALARWLASDDAEFKNDRLKLIAIVPEGPWIVRNLVTGKPALIGKRLDVSYKFIPRKNKNMECLQICDLDISSGTAIAKKTVNVTRRYLSTLQAVDIGFVIEGKSQAELPEEMMGSTRLHQVDPCQAPNLF